MTFRQRLGLGGPPILLRVALAITFIWAGSGKFFGSVTLSPEQAAVLDAMHSGAVAPATPAPEGADTDANTDADADSSPSASRGGPMIILAQDQGAQPAEPAEADAPPDADADEPPAAPAEADTADADADTAAPSHRNVDFIALLFHTWATPNAEGKALLPAFVGHGKTPIWLANAVGVTELLGGIMIALGLLTRLWSLAVAGVMVGALWTTSIGPVLVYGQAGWPAFFPVLPALHDFSAGAWQNWLWQLTLLCSALSLVCLGAGRLSLDRLFFGKPGAETHTPIILDDDED